MKNREKKNKQAVNSIYLVSVGCGRLEEGKGVFLEKLHVLSCFVQLKSVFVVVVF